MRTKPVDTGSTIAHVTERYNYIITIQLRIHNDYRITLRN